MGENWLVGCKTHEACTWCGIHASSLLPLLKIKVEKELNGRYGPLAVEHKKRVIQTQRRRRSIGAEQRPQEIVHQKQKGEKAAVDDMVANVVTVQKLIVEGDKGDGMKFLELVINPDDYGQTVENIFYASFLIKEGHAGIQVDDDGQIIIRMCLSQDR